MLAPETSIIRKLYNSHAHPFVRVVCGAPGSWDLNTAAVTFPSNIELATWSPCGRFIAVIWGDTLTVDILDPVTLQRLQTLEAPQGTPIGHDTLSFSPDSRVLTFSTVLSTSSDSEFLVIVWDLQTGGTVSTIKGQGPKQDISKRNPTSVTYSEDGKMIGVFCLSNYQATIFICNLTSGVHVHTHSLKIPHSSHIPGSNNIWTCGESLQFATATQTTITTWEVGFTSGTTPKEVKTISIKSKTFKDQPNLDPQLITWILFLPTLSRLAATDDFGTLLVWDAQDSKTLLCLEGMGKYPSVSVSSDGHFLACSTAGSKIYFWKESPTGYILQGVLTSSVYSNSLLSPTGESIVVFGDRLVQLWQTKRLAIPPPGTPTRSSQHAKGFVLDFSPDRTLALFARLNDNMATVLNLKSGVPQLTLHTSNRIYGLKMTKDTIAMMSGPMIITWDLPVGDYPPDTTMNIKDSTKVVTLDVGSLVRTCPVGTASISHDLQCVAVIAHDNKQDSYMDLYSTSTGEHHENVCGYKEIWDIPEFTPDGSKIWCIINGSEPKVWTITRGRLQGSPIGLVSEDLRVDPQNATEGHPWESSCGYQATDDGWVLGPDRKRLLMLLPPWQPNTTWRMWNGEFLVLLHGGLPEPVILELGS